MSIAYAISGWNRRRKWKLFLQEVSITSETTILDVGFSEKEYSLTDNFLEKHYPYPEKVVALGIDSPREFLTRYPKVKPVIYGGEFFPFRDRSFDICWSNAVLEHVGPREKQVLFLREMKRVAKKIFVTTPNKFFPIEVHTRTPFLHWMPKPIFDFYLRLIGRDWAKGDFMYLISSSELKKLLNEAGIKDYRMIQNRLLFWTLDFVIVM